MRLYSAGDGDLGRRELALLKFNFDCRAILHHPPVEFALDCGYLRGPARYKRLALGFNESCDEFGCSHGLPFTLQ
jgi:hypothetical protein